MDQPTQSSSQGPGGAGGRIRGFLECLTGPSRGNILWLTADLLFVRLSQERILRVDAVEGPDWSARLSWQDNHLILEAAEGQEIWVNGRAVTQTVLVHLDMIEFEADGPMTRLRLYDRAHPMRWSVDDIVSDAVAYARTSRKPFAPRVSLAVAEGGRRMVRHSTLFFRASVVTALVLLSVGAILLIQNDRRFEARLEQEAQRIAAVAAALSEARDRALTPDDLSALRQDLEMRVMTNAQRLESLERHSTAPARVIQETARSVAFVQGAFSLRHLESGKLLRQMVDEAGQPLNTPFGTPWIDPDGNGDVAEFQFTGTGFLVGTGGKIVTNRHVLRPWTVGERAEAFQAGGLAPEVSRLVAYLPGHTGPLNVTISKVSDATDLAILELESPPDDYQGLTLVEIPADAGHEVFVMGYPTGLRAMLAQAGPAFLAKLEQSGTAHFWSAAEHLSEADLIWPLASRGIIAKVSDNVIVYDAETTVGGSGGPVLDTQGRVVAINTAILPGFGGSNMGVPVALLRHVLEGRPAQ